MNVKGAFFSKDKRYKRRWLALLVVGIILSQLDHAFAIREKFMAIAETKILELAQFFG